MFRQSSHEIVLGTRSRGLYEFTAQVEKWIAENKFRDGLLTLHLRHTSASLLIQENADPDVRRDLDASGTMTGLDTFTTRAFEMVTSGTVCTLYM